MEFLIQFEVYNYSICCEILCNLSSLFVRSQHSDSHIVPTAAITVASA